MEETKTLLCINEENGQENVPTRPDSDDKTSESVVEDDNTLSTSDSLLGSEIDSVQNDQTVPLVDPNGSTPGSGAESSPPKVQEQQPKNEIEAIVCDIDCFTLDKEKERIRFVAVHIFPQLPKKEKPHDIFTKLKQKYDKQTVLSVFRTILTCAGVRNDYVDKLDSCCSYKPIDSETKDGFVFRQHLLTKEREIGQGESNVSLEEFVEQFSENDELGCRREHIKSFIGLLECLLRKDFVSLKVGPEVSCERISKRLTQARNARPAKMKIQDQGNEQPGPVREHVTASNKRKPEPFCTKRKACCVGCTAGVLIILLVVSVTLSGHYGRLSSQPSNNSVILYGNISVLATREWLNTQYSGDIALNITLDNDNLISTTHLCQFDCTNDLPKVRVFPLDVSRISHGVDGTRRYVEFNSGLNSRATSTYMLGGSNASFSVSLPDNETVSLYIFNSIMTCDMFEHNNGSDTPYAVFNLSNVNDSVLFKVPPDTPASYYCGVWVAQQGSDFDYSIRASIVEYDISVYEDRNQCVTLHGYDCVMGESGSHQCIKNLDKLASFVPLYTCVLLYKGVMAGKITADVIVHGTFQNVPFSLPASVFVFSIVLVVVALLMYCIMPHNLSVCTCTHGSTV